MNIKDKAKEFAINAHKGQIRKSDKEKPMIIHPINVADILSEYGFDDNVVAAGYLHDVIEDTKYTKEDLLKAFNEDILSLVLGDTEKDKSLSWEERKIETINIVKDLDLRHKSIVCADKISNLEDMRIIFETRGEKDFSAFKRGYEKQKWYYTEVYNSLIYNEDLQQESFYSPQIFAGESYKVTLTETVDGNSKSYSKGVIANESEIDMPEYVTNPDTDDESIIMVGDIEDLKSGKISTGNSISVDTNVAQYAHIKANEFKEYYSNLPSNKVYRIYTISNGDVYSGYMSTEDDIKFYDLTIDSCDWDSFYSPTLLSIPSYTTTDIKNNAVDARYTKYCYKLSETSNNSKCKIFKVAMPDSFLNEKNPPVFRVVVKGQSKVTAKIWYSADNGTLNSVVSRTSNNNTNTISYPLESLYNAKKVYTFMLWFT